MHPALTRAALVAVVFAGGFAAGHLRAPLAAVPAEASELEDRVFEMRTYTAPEGKLEALDARFREHTLTYFEKHGMTNVGYWIPLDEPGASNTIVYILAHDSREGARASWESFGADPGWREISRATQVDGRIVSGVESVFLRPADYSPIK